MKASNADIERAERRVENERDAGIRRARQALRGMGTIHCVDCEEPIERERLEALPSAERCIDCQMQAERRRRRYA